MQPARGLLTEGHRARFPPQSCVRRAAPQTSCPAARPLPPSLCLAPAFGSLSGVPLADIPERPAGSHVHSGAMHYTCRKADPQMGSVMKKGHAMRQSRMSAYDGAYIVTLAQASRLGLTTAEAPLVSWSACSLSIRLPDLHSLFGARAHASCCRRWRALGLALLNWAALASKHALVQIFCRGPAEELISSLHGACPGGCAQWHAQQGKGWRSSSRRRGGWQGRQLAAALCLTPACWPSRRHTLEAALVLGPWSLRSTVLAVASGADT